MTNKIIKHIWDNFPIYLLIITALLMFILGFFLSNNYHKVLKESCINEGGIINEADNFCYIKEKEDSEIMTRYEMVEINGKEVLVKT